MRLRTRLWLYGAALPTVCIAAAFAVGGIWFEHALVTEVDRGLVTQAAVEEVSLFDGPDGEPHLHIGHSPVSTHLESDAWTALYDPDGVQLAVSPAGVPAPLRLTPTSDALPRIETAIIGGTEIRTLTVSVPDQAGHLHSIRLAAPLANARATFRLYFRTAGVITLLVSLVLLALQTGHARSLERRIGQLAEHTGRVRDGDLTEMPPTDGHADVIGSLRDEIAAAIERLRGARMAQQRLTANAAHELKTPLAALRTTIDVAQRRERSADELREILQSLDHSVARLSRVATALLDLAEVEGAHWDARRTDLRALVDDAALFYRDLAETRDVIIEVEGPVHAWAVVAGEAVRRAVDNLLANALAYAPELSTVSASHRARRSPI